MKLCYNMKIVIVGWIFLAVMWLFAFNTPAHGDVWLHSATQEITFTQSCLDSTGLWYGLPDSIWIKVVAMDGSLLTDTRLTTADGRVSADNDDSSLVFTDQFSDIDGDGADSTYEITITTGSASATSVWFSQQSKRIVHVRPITANATEWDGTAAATADNGWVTATGFSTHDVDAIWDETRDGHTTTDTYGSGIDTLVENVIAIKAVTDATASAEDIADAVWGENDTTVVDTSQIGKWLNLNLDRGAAGSVTDANMAAIADSVWNVLRAGHVLDGTFGSNFQSDSADLKAVKAKTDKLKFDAEDTLVISYSGFALSNNTISTTAMAANTINSTSLSQTAVNEMLVGDGYEGIWNYTGHKSLADGTIAAMLYSDSAAIEAIKAKTDKLGFDANDSLVIERTNTLAAVEVDVTKWHGDAVQSPLVAGFPEVDIQRINGVAQSANDLESFATSCYDPATGHVAATVHALDGDTLSLEDLKDFADDGYDPAGDTVHTDIASGGAGGIPDTTNAYITLMGANYIKDSTILDEIHDSLGSQGWAVTGAASGPGNIPVRIFVLNTLDSSRVANADVTLRLAADGSHQHTYPGTTAEGWSIHTMNAVEYYVYVDLQSYTFTTPACTLTAAGDSLWDTTWATAATFSGDTTGLTEVVGYVKSFDVGVKGAVISFSLNSSSRIMSGNTLIMPFTKTDQTDSDGLYEISVPPTTFVNENGDSVFYDVRIQWDNMLDITNDANKGGVRVPDSSASVFLNDLFGW